MNNTRASGNLSLKNINVGAGTHLIVDGYLHIDFTYDEDFVSRYIDSKDVGIYKCDLSKEFPHFKNVETIYTCHLLEHLSIEDGYSLINKCYDSLGQGCKIRICVPDFEMWFNALKNNDTKFFDFYRNNTQHKLNDVYKNDFAMFSTVLYHHEHRMIYTFDVLSAMLNKIGFKSIERKEWGDSTIHNINILEAKDNLIRSKESLIIEAVK